MADLSGLISLLLPLLLLPPLLLLGSSARGAVRAAAGLCTHPLSPLLILSLREPHLYTHT
jgi:hypothetical protein